MKIALCVAAAAFLMMLTGCESLASVFGDGGRVADQLLADGVITREQHTAMTGGGWGDLLKMVANTASTLLIGVPIIRTWRGPATKAENVGKKQAAKAAPAA